MARVDYGGTGAELLVTTDPQNAGALIPAANVQCTLYDAETGGNEVTDLQDGSGNGISAISSDANGRLPRFRGPDNFTQDLWLQPPSGARYRVPVAAAPTYTLISQVDATGATEGQGLFFRTSAGKFVPADAIRVTAAGVGFYGTTAQTKPTITGSRGGNAALASLLTALADLGLITNSTS